MARAVRAAEVAEEARVAAESPPEGAAGGSGGGLVSPTGMVEICDGDV